MGNRLVTGNINEEYRKATSRAVNFEGLPDAIQKKMKRKSVSGLTVDRVADQYYNPFLQTTEIEVPKDRKERNRWYRYFFLNEPIVHSALTLHTMFPLSSFRVSHEDKEIEDSFNEMIEDIRLFDFILEMGLEYWITGECFPFGFFDNPDDPKMWTDFILLHPNFVEVEGDPWVRGKRKKHIWLTPTDGLKKIVEAGPNDPKTGSLYRNLPSDTIEGVKNGKMELGEVQVSHVKRPGMYFNTRGTSIIDCILKPLMYRDKLRSAQYSIADRHISPSEFYFIGEQGDPADEDELEKFQNALVASWTQPNRAIIWHHAVRVQWEGACLDSETECLTKQGFKKYTDLGYTDDIATYNLNSGCIEYQNPLRIHVYDYDGELLHFKQQNVDFMVTPNHKLLYLPDTHENRGDEENSTNWKVSTAEDVLKCKRFRTKATWVGSEQYPHTINIGAVDIGIEDFLQLGGWFIAEGCISNKKIDIAQSSKSKAYEEMCLRLTNLGFHCYSYKDISRFRLSNRLLQEILLDSFGNSCKTKHIISWVKNLPVRLLQILLKALVQGDGSQNKEYITYWTTSRILANDVQEIVWKCGYAPRVSLVTPESKKGFGKAMQYAVMWSPKIGGNKKNLYGSYPSCNTYPQKVMYQGKVWCVTVPNGFFVIRRKGLLNITGNSGKILPLQPEFDMIDNQILIGLMVSKGVIFGEGPSFSNASVALDILIQRYLSFRMQIEKWIENCVFAPICKIHGLYKPTQAEIKHRIKIEGKDKPLWLPQVKWDKENLRDNMQKLDFMFRLADKGIVPWKMITDLLDFDWEKIKKGMDDQRKDLSKAGLPTAPKAPSGLSPLGLPIAPELGGGGAPGAVSPVGAGGLPTLPGAKPSPLEGGGPIPPESHVAPGIPVG